MTEVILSSILFLVIGVLAVQHGFNRRRILALEAARRTLVQQKATALDLMNRIGTSIHNNMDLDVSLGIITDYIVDATEAQSGAIFLLDAQGQHLQARSVVGMFPPIHQTSAYGRPERKYLAEKIKKDKIDIKEGIIGFVASSGQPLLISDGLTDPRVPKFSTDFLQINSIIAAPLRQRQKIVGVFAVVNKRHNKLFSEDDLHLLQMLSDQAALTVDIVRLYEHQAERKRIEQELQVARDFQQMLLPKHPPEVPGLDIAALSQPAREVGGDYYDFFWIDQQHLGIVIMDVAGKGIPGALAVAMVRSALKAAAPGNLSPRDVLRTINLRMKEDTQQSIFITASYGILNIHTHRFTFVRAGHEPLLTWNRDDPRPQIISPRGIALGLVQTEMFDLIEEYSIDLKPGDTAVLYTDGVIEAIDRDEEEYGLEQMLPIATAEPAAPANQTIQRVMNDIQRFSAGMPQHDDITMVVLKVLAEGQHQSQPQNIAASNG